jgi:hypothetical protein
MNPLLLLIHLLGPCTIFGVAACSSRVLKVVFGILFSLYGIFLGLHLYMEFEWTLELNLFGSSPPSGSDFAILGWVVPAFLIATIIAVVVGKRTSRPRPAQGDREE